MEAIFYLLTNSSNGEKHHKFCCAANENRIALRASQKNIFHHLL